YLGADLAPPSPPALCRAWGWALTRWDAVDCLSADVLPPSTGSEPGVPASVPDHAPSSVHGRGPDVGGAMPHAHQSATVAAGPGLPPGQRVGGVCQATRRWSWTGIEVSRALYASRGDRESSPASAGGRAGDLSVERLCPWQPSTAHDPRGRRIHPALPAPYLARRFPASPPLWVARKSRRPGDARAVPRAAPAAGEPHTTCAS